MRSRILLTSAALAAQVLILSCSPSFATALPADHAAVAGAVGAAFALPACIAGVLGLLKRIGRALGPVLATGLSALALLALASYLQPELMGMLAF